MSAHGHLPDVVAYPESCAGKIAVGHERSVFVALALVVGMVITWSAIYGM